MRKVSQIEYRRFCNSFIKQNLKVSVMNFISVNLLAKKKSETYSKTQRLKLLNKIYSSIFKATLFSIALTNSFSLQ